jgi:hypothetical protein
MAFGVVNTGFNIKRLDDIKASIEADLKGSSNFGNDIDTSAGSVIGQLVGTFSKALAENWEQIGNDYAQQRISQATGVNLDYLVALNGVTRLPETPTVVNSLGLAGTSLTVVPALTQVKNSVTNELFQLLSDTQITNLGLNQIFVTIDTVVDSTVYTITIGGTPQTINSGVGATADSIAQALVDDINITNPSSFANATKLLDGRMQLDAVSGVFDTLVDSNMSYYTPAIVESINTGEILAVANTLTIIETPVAGLNEVNNFLDGELGRPVESDAELRQRYNESLQIIGAGTLEAIVARVKQSEEIDATTVKGFENREDVVDGEGRPPHSYEIVLLSPDTPQNDQAIADLLWLIKPAGIETFGNTSATAIDSNGDNQVMNFTRPTSVFAWVRITYVADPESVFPSDGVDTIKNCVLGIGSEYDIGQNIKPLDFSCCVSNFPGIESAVIEVSGTATAGGPPIYSTNVYQIDDNGEIAVFDLTRIEVTT